MGTRPRRKLLKTNTSNKDWKDSYIFITIPEGFPLPRRWTVINRDVSIHPTLSDEEWVGIRKLESIPKSYHTVDILMAEEQLQAAGLSIGERR